MSFQLTINEEVFIPIPMDNLTLEAWQLQYGRAAEQGAIEGFYKRLGMCFATTLSECLDADLKPPTQAQLKYATAIARDLNLALPPEALRFRGAMTDFLGRFAEVHKQQRRTQAQ
ncbi:hypothetical protein [Dyella mobilis]|uniref:Uncharacterized protein n=1 Tax=Dyella mobilis TaxID=1849582 RepID=A0ABS2KCW4_9GAMM|nr:hypothetical protein [Dyella mobilis]MBM7128665.1 hypothetical protein [Dyella mobilis]GLQ98987.1 hypothetical protein GCM10007863_34070 [Dyella mobilis]